ncbi:MAG TPA: helix-turn-helix transcriptional regulator [Streptosporangiaceae bacterium]
MNRQLLRKRRDELGMPQFEVAHRMGAAYRTFVRWEAGESEPRVSEYLAWCRVLDLDPAAALTEPVEVAEVAG